MVKPGRGGANNITPPANKPHGVKKKRSRPLKGADKAKKFLRLGRRSGDKTGSKPHRNSFEGLNPDEVLGSENSVDGGGFISLMDDDDESDVKSVHTSTFAAFEAELDNEAEEEEQDYVAINGKRKRSEETDQIINAEYPWVRTDDHSRQKVISDWLTLEIKDFVQYMSPSIQEIEGRNDAVRRIRKLVHELWHDAEAHVFGSYATDLYLPGSDIDMVILSPRGTHDDRRSLYQLSSKLRASGIAKRMEVLAKARVPIIKFVEASTNIHVDISFERRNGLTAVKTITSWIKSFPCLRYFVLVIKQFLAKRKLNEVHTGGLGGFAVICMVVSFLRNHPRVASHDIDVESNMGVLLIEFFELYGKHFNYDEVALCMSGNMGYKLKAEHEHLQNKNPFALSIEDPNDPDNNLSRGSFNTRGIKKAFNGAFEILSERCCEMEHAPFRNRRGQSILGYLIRLKGPLRDFEDSRDLVRNESNDVKLAKKSLKIKESEAPPAKLRKPDVLFISDDESSDDEKKKSKSPSVIVIDSSENDSAPASVKSDVSDNDEDSRTQALEKEKKKHQYWSQKAGVASD